MSILKKEMSRKDFLKYTLGGVALFSLATIIPKIPKLKENKKQIKTGYGSGSYGR